MALEGAMTVATVLGLRALVPWLIVRYVGFFLIGAGIWGLTYYVAYVWSGSEALRLPLAVLFAALSSALLFYTVQHRPLAVAPADWLVRLDMATPPQGVLYTAILAGFAAPPILAAVGYLSLWTRTQRRDQRYRIALVGTSIILYLGTGVVVRSGTNDFLMFVNLAVVGLGMSAAVLLAYRPPSAIRAWLGLASSDAFRPHDKETEKRLKRQALVERCRELV